MQYWLISRRWPCGYLFDLYPHAGVFATLAIGPLLGVLACRRLMDKQPG